MGKTHVSAQDVARSSSLSVQQVKPLTSRRSPLYPLHYSFLKASDFLLASRSASDSISKTPQIRARLPEVYLH